MLRVWWCIALTAWSGAPQLTKPKPLSPARSQVIGDSVRFATDAWFCRIDPLSGNALRRELISLGAAEKTLDRPAAAEAFRKMVAFRVEFQNTGDQALNFNPDQALLHVGSGAAHAGFQVDMAHFWPTSGQDPGLTSLARALSKMSASIEPGRLHRQLLVFRPIGGKFSRRVRLELGRLYYGAEETKVSCQFTVRYPKK